MEHRKTLRKAAILLASLDEQSADALLRQMSPEQAQRMQEVLAELGAVDPLEQSEVIEEFFRIGPLVPGKDPAGIELDDRLASHLSLPRQLNHAGGWSDDDELSEPLCFLRNAPSEALQPLLQREHPQTIAVIVSHLPPDRAGRLLADLPSALQADVARRLVELDETDPEILREIEHGLRTWLAQQERTQERRTAGMAALTSILQATDPDTQQALLSNLAAHDRQLAQTFLPQHVGPVSFADLERLDDESLTAVLHRADTGVMILALSQAREQTIHRVMGQLPLAEANTLRYALAHLGPTRSGDVEDAQQELIALARTLWQNGHLPGAFPQHLSLAG